MRTDPLAELADSILDQAQALRRDARDPDAVARHMHAMRVLAAAHVDPALDRGFYRELKAASLQRDGVFVHFVDGVVNLIVDAADASVQHRFDLVSPAQLERRGYESSV